MFLQIYKTIMIIQKNIQIILTAENSAVRKQLFTYSDTIFQNKVS